MKPKYVLMENVVDILQFAGGFLGRYALGRLVAMNYQARMGMMAAGSYIFLKYIKLFPAENCSHLVVSCGVYCS